MGKKNTTKKHKFKHVETGVGARAPELSTSGSASGDSIRGSATRSPSTAVAGAGGRDFSYVGSDLRRIAVMAGALVVLELVLYYVLVYTPAGTAIYSLVKV
jgi:hypothetical protein